MCKATPKGVFDEDNSHCKNGWFNSTDDSTGHYCIKAFSDLKTFNAADTFCQNTHGGSLVSIHSPKEDQRVRKVARSVLGSKAFLLDMKKLALSLNGGMVLLRIIKTGMAVRLHPMLKVRVEPRYLLSKVTEVGLN